MPRPLDSDWSAPPFPPPRFVLALMGLPQDCDRSRYYATAEAFFQRLRERRRQVADSPLEWLLALAYAADMQPAVLAELAGALGQPVAEVAKALKLKAGDPAVERARSILEEVREGEREIAKAQDRTA